MRGAVLRVGVGVERGGRRRGGGRTLKRVRAAVHEAGHLDLDGTRCVVGEAGWGRSSGEVPKFIERNAANALGVDEFDAVGVSRTFVSIEMIEVGRHPLSRRALI